MSTELTAPTNAGGSGGKPPTGKSTSGGASGGAGGGFFKLYKPGQGYWTRLGTALGAAAIILFIAWFTFNQTVVFLHENRAARFGIAAGVAGLLCLLTWWLMNAPKRAQFLIDTDSEMKKVNWASWSELRGSTQIVVFFMVLTAVILFTLDTQYHAFFFFVRVWHIEFNSLMGQVTGGLLGITLLVIAWAVARGQKRSRQERHAAVDETGGRGKLIAAIAGIVGLAIVVAWTIYTLNHTPGTPPVTPTV